MKNSKFVDSENVMEKLEPKTEFIITKIDIVDEKARSNINRQSVETGSSFSPSSDNTSSDSNIDELKMSRVHLIKQRLGIELEKKVFNNMRNVKV